MKIIYYRAREGRNASLKSIEISMPTKRLSEILDNPKRNVGKKQHIQLQCSQSFLLLTVDKALNTFRYDDGVRPMESVIPLLTN